MRCKHAVLDHLSMATCAGFEGGSFSEVQEVWRDLAVPWAGAFGDACRAVLEKLRAPDAGETRGKLDLERTIKWKFLLPSLLLRKPPATKGIRAMELKPIVQRRLNQYDAGD